MSVLYNEQSVKRIMTTTITELDDFKALDPFFRIIKVTHWRDYLDPVAVFDALGWPSR